MTHTNPSADSLVMLMVGSFGPMALENAYAHNLKLLGHQIHECETHIGFRDNLDSFYHKVKNRLKSFTISREINKKIIDTHRSVRPDVLMVFKGADISYQTLEEIKSTGTILVNYNPDHPLFFERENKQSENIRMCIELFDLYLTYATRIVQQLTASYNIQVEHLPFGYDDRLEFTKQFSNKTDELIFVGNWDQNRSSWLSKVKGEELRIFGNKDWSLREIGNKRILDAYTGSYLVGQEYADKSHQSLAVINLLRNQNLKEESHNMRTFEVPGYGGLLLAQRTEEQLSYFKEDEEAVFFEGIEELNDKLAFLKSHPKHVSRIKENAYHRSRKSGYSYFDRTKMLSNFLIKMKKERA